MFIIAWTLVIAATLAVLVLAGVWTIQPFSPSGSITSIDLGVDSQGAVHIVFTDGYDVDARLEYATNAGGSWVTQTLATAQNASNVRLAIDSRDKLHIVYGMGTWVNGTYTFLPKVEYLTNANGVWDSKTLALNAVVPSIAVGSGGAVYVAYSFHTFANDTIPYDNESLHLMTNADGSWANSTLWGWTDAGGSIVYLTSIAVDPQGSVHLVYQDAFWLRYMTNATGSWSSEWLEPNANPGVSPPSLALDPAGRIHVGFEGYRPPGATDLPEHSVIHAVRADGKWTYESVDEWGGVDPSYAAMALDAKGNAHFVYSDRLTGTLKYATNAGGAWAVTTLEHGYVTGLHAAIAVDARGRPHVAYEDVCCGFSDETPKVPEGSRYGTTVVTSSNLASFLSGNLLLFGLEFVVMGIGALLAPRLVLFLKNRVTRSASRALAASRRGPRR